MENQNEPGTLFQSSGQPTIHAIPGPFRGGGATESVIDVKVGCGESISTSDLQVMTAATRHRLYNGATLAVSPSAFLGACSLRNLRQIAIEVL
jgi:hypothetical protein